MEHLTKTTQNIQPNLTVISMDNPTGRVIKIGNVTIGLMGLDTSLNKALAEKMNANAATDFIYDMIEEQNYIPNGMIKQYKEAIKREYQKLQGIKDEDNKGLIIRIFGTGCTVCNTIHAMVIDAMMREGIAADIEMIHDPDEIGRHGVMSTPAIMINGQIKVSGRQPTPAQLQDWLSNP